jgi:hypothetical protein
MIARSVAGLSGTPGTTGRGAGVAAWRSGIAAFRHGGITASRRLGRSERSSTHALTESAAVTDNRKAIEMSILHNIRPSERRLTHKNNLSRAIIGRSSTRAHIVRSTKTFPRFSKRAAKTKCEIPGVKRPG